MASKCSSEKRNYTPFTLSESEIVSRVTIYRLFVLFSQFLTNLLFHVWF